MVTLGVKVNKCNLTDSHNHRTQQKERSHWISPRLTFYYPTQVIDPRCSMNRVLFPGGNSQQPAGAAPGRLRGSAVRGDAGLVAARRPLRAGRLPALAAAPRRAVDRLRPQLRPLLRDLCAPALRGAREPQEGNIEVVIITTLQLSVRSNLLHKCSPTTLWFRHLV